MEQQYTLRYCYRYEPGFDVYSLWDIILYKDGDDDDITGNVYDYLRKEEELIDKEDEFQVFYRVNHFKYSKEGITSIPFLKLELFPTKSNDTSVINLVYIPLQKGWKGYSNLEQLLIIDEEVKKQEKYVDFTYKLVNYSVEDIDVDSGKDLVEEMDDSYLKADLEYSKEQHSQHDFP